jgi:hypothetical protein
MKSKRFALSRGIFVAYGQLEYKASIQRHRCGLEEYRKRKNHSKDDPVSSRRDILHIKKYFRINSEYQAFRYCQHSYPTMNNLKTCKDLKIRTFNEAVSMSLISN